jgi:alpha-N-arabinofuranosidase
MLPVLWKDDWPVILEGDAQVPYARRRPTLPKQPAPAVPTSGEFEVRDEFDGPTLPMYWVTIRGPGTQWYHLDTPPGALTLHARSARFDPKSQPSFVGRRQQHRDFSASTSMTYVPAKDGDKAGIIAFQNDEYYYLLSLTRLNGQTMVQVEKHAGPGVDSVVALAHVPINGRTPLFLKIQGQGGKYDFSYATQPGEWNVLLANADGTILSTKVASGFVGAMLGLYAYSPWN